MLAESKGKISKGNNFSVKEILEKFPFPYKVKNSNNSENFPQREKVGENREFLRERKWYPLKGVI